MSFYSRPVTPAEISSDLRKLIDQLVNGGQSTYVDVNSTNANGQVNHCFSTVDAHVQSNGGQAIYGWALWELPTVFVEAEFHCVWRNPQGQLIDITPKKYSTQKIFFLQDPSRSYSGKQVNNVRLPISSDPNIKKYLDTFDDEFNLLNAGSLAAQLGSITLTGEAAIKHSQIQAKRAELATQISLHPVVGQYLPCPCGTGKKVKWCCNKRVLPR